LLLAGAGEVDAEARATRVSGDNCNGTAAQYDETQIDFLVAYLVLEDVWYVIPVKMLRGRNTLQFHPNGRGTSKWERFREGWCQMACPYDEFGPSKIVTPRCRDKGPVQMAICPLKVLR
jgi:hypothetical protein